MTGIFNSKEQNEFEMPYDNMTNVDINYNNLFLVIMDDAIDKKKDAVKSKTNVYVEGSCSLPDLYQSIFS